MRTVQNMMMIQMMYFRFRPSSYRDITNRNASLFGTFLFCILFLSSVKLALNALIKNGIVAKVPEGYYIYDRYLSL